MDSVLSDEESKDVPRVEASIALKTFVIAVVIWKMTLSIFESIFTKLFKKPKSLRDKVCLITGSGRGLGRELCLELAREGAVVACADINGQNNEVTLAMVKNLGAKGKAYEMNVASKEEVEDTIAKIEDELGPIHLLVNNAAIIIEMKDPTEEFIRALFSVNVLGSMWTTGAVLPRMNARKEGQIVYISSAAAHYGCCLIKYYSATKAALTNFAQGLRIELMLNESNVKITTVHPYYMNSSKDILKIVEERLFPPKGISKVYRCLIKSFKLLAEEDYLKTRYGEIVKACSSKIKKI